jgi:hypothetical protein
MSVDSIHQNSVRHLQPIWVEPRYDCYKITKIVLAFLIVGNLTLFFLGATKIYDIPELKWISLGTFTLSSLTLFFFSLCGNSSSSIAATSTAANHSFQSRNQSANLPALKPREPNTPLPGLPTISGPLSLNTFTYLEGMDTLPLIRVNKGWRDHLSQDQMLWKTYCLRERFIAPNTELPSYLEHYRQVRANSLFATALYSPGKSGTYPPRERNIQKVGSQIASLSYKGICFFSTRQMQWDRVIDMQSSVFSKVYRGQTKSIVEVKNQYKVIDHGTNTIETVKFEKAPDAAAFVPGDENTILVGFNSWTKNWARKGRNINLISEYDLISNTSRTVFQTEFDSSIVGLEFFDHPHSNQSFLLSLFGTSYDGFYQIEIIEKKAVAWRSIRSYSVRGDTYCLHKKSGHFLYASYPSGTSLIGINLLTGKRLETPMKDLRKLSCLGDTLLTLSGYSEERLDIWNISDIQNWKLIISRPAPRNTDEVYLLHNGIACIDTVLIEGNYHHLLNFLDFSPVALT